METEQVHRTARTLLSWHLLTLRGFHFHWHKVVVESLHKTCQNYLAISTSAQPQLMGAVQYVSFPIALPRTTGRLCFPLMSVILETSVGDIVVDLLINDAPRCCEKYVPCLMLTRLL